MNAKTLLKAGVAIGLFVVAFAASAFEGTKLSQLKVGDDIYRNVTVTEVTATDIYFSHDGGIGNSKLKKLDPEMQKRFGFNTTTAAAAEKRQNAANAEFQKELTTTKPAKPAKASTTAKPAAGRPRIGGSTINPGAVDRLCDYIVREGHQLLLYTNNGQVVWSDNRMLELGTSFASPRLKEIISGPGEYLDAGPWFKFVNDAKGPEWKDAYITPPKDGIYTIKSADGEMSTLVEAAYIEYIRHRYPNAKVRVQGELDPVIFVLNGKIRALVMPFKWVPQ